MYRRWLVLAAYFGVVAASHMLWLNIAPLTSIIQEKYQIGDMAVSLLLLVFPLLYLLLSWNAGALIDRKGYRYAVLFGSAITAVFSLLRIVDGNFACLFFGQVGIAFGQPYIVNSISVLVADQFDEGSRATATGIGTAGMLVGMAIGLGLTPVLYARAGFSATMLIFALTTLFITAIFYFATMRVVNQAVSLGTQKTGAVLNEIRWNRALVKLYLLWFVAYGAFNGLTTWLEPILKRQGIDAIDAGLTGACIIAGGIAGCLIIPVLADRWRLRKTIAVLCCLSALIIAQPFFRTDCAIWLLMLGFLFGFLFLPGYPIVLAMCQEVANKAQAGAAVSLLMLSGNAGAAIVIVLMPLVNNGENEWGNAIYLLQLMFGIALLLSLGLSSKSTLSRSKQCI